MQGLFDIHLLYLHLSMLQVRNGHIKRITDNDIQSLVLEIAGTNVRYVTYSIICCKIKILLMNVIYQ